MNLLKTYILLILLAVTTSCSDFLTLKPSNYNTTDNAITNVNEAGVAINGIMSKLTSSSYYGRQFLLYADYKGGDLVIPMLGRQDATFFTFEHEQSSGNYSNIWNTIYNVILQANNVIINIEAGNVATTSKEEESDLANYKGQALALRALCNFDLVRLYGYPFTKDNGASLGVPIVKTLLDASAKPTRSTVAEVYDFILQDLAAAIPLLYAQKNNGFMNQWAAKTLLSRVYLYKGDYDNAFTVAEDVYKNGGYSLYENNKWADSWKAQFGTESIFELVVSSEDDNDLGSSSPRSVLLPYKVENAQGSYHASDIFLNLLKKDMSDVRWGVMQEDVNEKPGVLNAILKYNGDGKSKKSATNVKIMRLSEVVLIAAEAALKKSAPDKKAAADYLNMIRKRSPKALAATASDTDLEAKILEERCKELATEGHRFFDLMRLNQKVKFDYFKDMPTNGRPDEIDWSYYRVVLPISQSEINANPAIKDQQNPGYK